ncbi:MAG: response regulator [Proteobacteria bacterium]|nr:response regulator [Pseudomonadota bacterium]
MASVLVVDDHEAFLIFVKHGLSRHGYHSLVATSAKAALRLLETEPVEIAVIDVVMPDMDGIELLREIRDRHPSLPVIAMTGAGDGLRQPVATLLSVLGACAVLIKPFEPASLIRAIEDCRSAARAAPPAAQG